MLHDSWLRPRQTHVLSPESGKVIVTDTRYEGRGLVAATSQPQALTGTAGAGLLPVPAGGWANDETTAYDELRRPVWQISWTAGAARRSVVTDYTHDSVTTTPHPLAGGVVRTVSDAHGRVTKVEERDGAAWRPTQYGYDKADRLTTITDPAGNTITNTYDLAGRKIAMTDPDMGAWTYGFDAAGNQTRATNAAGTQVHTLYDALDRPAERRRDSPPAPCSPSGSTTRPGRRGCWTRPPAWRAAAPTWSTSRATTAGPGPPARPGSSPTPATPSATVTTPPTTPPASPTRPSEGSPPRP
ncbi:hypothetical protein ACFQ0B_55540 [Nonomuraea thailandensis]